MSIVHISLVNTIRCYEGESPETSSIQVSMKRVVFMSLFTSFPTPLVRKGGRKGNMALYKH